MPENLEDLPAGSIIIEENQIIKIHQPRETNSPKTKKTIANFGIRVLGRSETEYLLQINNQFRIDKLDFTATLASFRKWIRPFVFTGTPEDLEATMGALLSQTSGMSEDKLITCKNFVGKYEDPRITFWVFDQQLLITHQNGGQLTPPILRQIPPDGVLGIADFYVYVNNEGINPALVPEYHAPEGYTLQEFMKAWFAQLKNPHLLYALLGWIIATFHLEKVNMLRGSRFFPFFVVTAQTETGKTALLANCMHICGVNYVGENFAASVTPFVEMMEFSQVSHFPIWRDEYKNELNALKKEGWLRSVYTRAASSRGRADQSITQIPTRATLLLSGEDITDDPALARRMLKFRLFKEDRISKEEHERVMEEGAKNFRKVLPLLLSRPFDDQVFQKIFQNNVVPDDTLQKDELMCYAALGAVLGEEWGRIGVDIAIQAHGEKKNLMNEKQTTVTEFFEQVMSMFIEKGYFEGKFAEKPKALEFFHVAKAPADPHTIFCRLTPLFPTLNKWRAHQDYRWSSKSIKQMLRENYNVESGKRRLDGVGCDVMIVNRADQIEDSFGDFLERIEKVAAEWEESQRDREVATPHQMTPQHPTGETTQPEVEQEAEGAVDPVFDFT